MSVSNAVQTNQDPAVTKTSRKPSPALMKPLQPSTELAAVVGSSPLSRPEVVSKVWEYMKAKSLQNTREIMADKGLRSCSPARAR